MSSSKHAAPRIRRLIKIPSLGARGVGIGQYKIDTLRSNDAMTTRTSLKKWICVLSVFIAIIPAQLVILSSVDEPSWS